LGIKTGAAVLWFGPQNHRDDFLVWASKPSGRRFVDSHLKTAEQRKTMWGHVSTSGGLLHAKQVELGFPSFALKLVEERQRVVHVASSWRSRGSEAKDDQFNVVECGVVEVGPSYPLLDAIFLLVHMGILVFYFHYK
jgi:hypothetical protein